jgi:uncharacterized protein (DUF885 family)
MSIFNPWVLLSILLSIIGAFGSGYYKGGNDESARNQIEVAKLNQQARATEQKMVEQSATIFNQLQKVNQDADKKQAQLKSDLATSNLRLFVNLKTSGISVSNDPTNGNTETTGQLDNSISEFLIGITTTGDKAINELNSCIDQYNNAYILLKGK